ncbi:hypothetical protein [Allokutzneria oryzae]|uniref:DUF4261 domain-containing protein n=1 Tax=Allokutzneria oryzae TaxID=1378989 RepID=A0ABV6A6E9_9PSEU
MTDGPRMVRIDQWNAFGVNSIGADAAPFPLSIEVVPAGPDGTWTVHGTAATTYDLVDALPWRETVAVLNIGQNSWMDEELRSLPPREIARGQGVPAQAHDVSWTSRRGAPANDLLVLARRDLRQFFADWSLYDVDILDWDGVLTEQDAEELALAVNSRDDDAALLPALPRCRTHLRTHDDCYLTVRSLDSSVPARVLARLLALFAASALGIEDGGTITEPPRELAAGLLERSPFWTGRITGTEQYGVEIGLAPQGWRPNGPVPRAFPVGVRLDRVTGLWTQEWNGAGD